MKLVIAGASGFIGSVLVQRLRQRNDALVLLSRKPGSREAATNTSGLYGSRARLVAGKSPSTELTAW